MQAREYALRLVETAAAQHRRAAQEMARAEAAMCLAVAEASEVVKQHELATHLSVSQPVMSKWAVRGRQLLINRARQQQL